MWELPGGKTEPGESPPHCLKRELHEELGITVRMRDLQFFDVSFYEYGMKRVYLMCFIVKKYTGTLLPTVHEDARWVAINAIDTYRLAPADVPIMKRLQRYLPL